VRVVLASASPARLATLRAAGVDAEAIASGVDESAFDEPDAPRLTTALARAKARAVAALPAAAGADVVIGCDSLLALDGQTLGKPRDAAEATARWQAMRGRSATLVTGHCVIRPSLATAERELTAAASTVVHFANLSSEEIAEYVLTEEPLGVAGAFTVDGRGGAFVTAIEGDYHNVVGISLPLLRDLVHDLGLRWTDLWR
jgi:septum formation protein